MLSLLVLLFFLLMLMSMVRAISRIGRRRRELEEARRAAYEREQLGGGGGSPFAGMPFGGLFDAMLGGGWTRTLEYDERTGQWVEVDPNDALGEEPVEEEAGDARAEPQADRPPAGREERLGARRRPARRSAPANPLQSLLGGALGGANGEFEVQPPDELITFADVGGMEALKDEVRTSVGLLLEHPEQADQYGIEWNGILLHGAPGVGKTFFAQAIAGEYRMSFIHVSTGDLVAGVQGQSAKNIDKAFQTALDHLPCVLFFDEFDSVARRRSETPDQESRRTVNQLLTSLEAHRHEDGLLVMAATNDVEGLDPAVVRPGRFDRHIRVDLPDATARRAILETELDNRPVADDLDLEDLVRRTEGMTPASIEKVVNAAALDVFREAAQTGRQLQLDEAHLLAAVEQLGGEDRPVLEHWTWESLVLPEETKGQLRQLQAIIEDPESARRFGVEPPSGLLLAGPPGTGKTTVAKVIAAQARCSFYPVSGADVMSKWVGESEGNIRRLFERARANRPSVVFIDEIDAIAGRRGEFQVHDTQVNQLLSEIDGIAGQRGVFVIGATNRPDQLDPALLRGGRLSRTIVLGLPDELGRLAILRLHTARMPTVGVDLDVLAARTEGYAPADLKALCQEAALAAMSRGAEAQVTMEDFEAALARVGSKSRTPALR
ncbi:AAA family ATPase [Conexibacter sp. SYSU D00693]|uniref:AAA family ATPase n=1 Tax=Conexibacter sp. SYSU D00693 TaxID=2812560 RepID=UPI00196B55CC|nr:AAA family ATPase [Conexibacter sp. SYSU D00693]